MLSYKQEGLFMVKRLFVTGYKPFELGIFSDQHEGIPIIKQAIRDHLMMQLDDGLEWVIVSGQLGVEAWTCEVVNELKHEYPTLKYAVLLPFKDSEKNWNEANQSKFNQMVGLSDFSTLLTNRPYEGAWQFQAKDDFIFQNTDGACFIYDEENEGSPKFTKRSAEAYAQHHTYEIFQIQSYDLQSIAEDMQRAEWE